MRVKNYYKTLQVNYTATQADIKKAYRKLVMIYHPDKNKEAIAESHFKEIQEAYYHLSDVHRRSAYDQKNWFSKHKVVSPEKEPLTAVSIYKKTRKLSDYLRRIHKGDINKKALAQYLHHLINPQTSALITDEKDERIKKDIIMNVIRAAGHVSLDEVQKMTVSVRIIAGSDAELNTLIDKIIRETRLTQTFDRLKPWLILLISVLLCLFIYFVSR